MRRKTLDSMREIRLWITTIGLPVIGAAGWLMSKTSKGKEILNKVKTKLDIY